ncbi:hypothetical protein J9788_01275 [Serratia sp. X10]|uniref:hypothetical protein n=1 Tax=Serratia sp. X10 TaxID=2782608 RepID=UPI0015F54688|nr:hypothetical protein [Serratia sp. X10]MCH6191275.1 hypothetical protein [Serratia sp. X10]
MIANDKITSLIVKLNKDTVNRTIKWIYVDDDKYKIEGTDDIVPLMYICAMTDKHIAMYERKSKHWLDDVDYTWNSDVYLAIMSHDGKIIWDTKQPTQALRDLFETVRRQSSGLDDILDELFNKSS